MPPVALNRLVRFLWLRFRGQVAGLGVLVESAESMCGKPISENADRVAVINGYLLMGENLFVRNACM